MAALTGSRTSTWVAGQSRFARFGLYQSTISSALATMMPITAAFLGGTPRAIRASVATMRGLV